MKKLAVSILGLFWAVLIAQADILTSEDNHPLRVLCLISYHFSDPATGQFISLLEKKLKALPSGTDLNVFELDTLRTRDRKIWSDKLDYYLNSPDKIEYDLIITLDDEALDVLLTRPYVCKTPVIFAGHENYSPEMKLAHPNITGSFLHDGVKESIELGQLIFPAVQRAIVLIDRTDMGRKLEKRLKEQLSSLGKFNIEFLNNTTMSMEEISKYLADQPNQDFFLILTHYRNISVYKEQPIKNRLAEISQKLKYPILTTHYNLLESGAAGGMITAPSVMAAKTFAQILTVIKMGNAINVPVVETDLTPVFDYTVLEKHNINPNIMPKNTKFINQQGSIWQGHRKEIAFVATVIMLFFSSLVSFFVSRFHVSRRYLKVMRSLPLNIITVSKNERITFAHGSRLSPEPKTLEGFLGGQAVLLDAVRDALRNSKRRVLDYQGYTHVITPIFNQNTDKASSVAWVSYDSRDVQILQQKNERLARENLNLLNKFHQASKLVNMSCFESDFNYKYISYTPEVSFWPKDSNGHPEPMEKWVHPDDLGPALNNQEMLRQGKIQKACLNIRNRSSINPQVFRLTLTRMPEDHGQPKVLGVLQDVTAEEAVREQNILNESLFNVLFNNLPFGIAIKSVKNDFKYIQCNQKLCSILGLPMEKILGHTNHNLALSATTTSRFQEEDEEAIRNSKSLKFSAKFTQSNGNFIFCDKVKNLVKSPSGNDLIVVTLMDITSLHNLLESERLLNQSLSLLASADGFEANLDHILQMTQKRMDCDMVWLAMFDEKRSRYIVKMTTDKNSPLMNDGEINDCLSLWHLDLINDHQVAISDTSKSPLTKSLQESGIKSIILTPIFLEKNYWGLLIIDFRNSSRMFSSSEKQLLHSLAHIISQIKLHRNYIDSLTGAMHEAQQANQTKSAFISSVSHEIRTPLNAVIGFANLLLNKELPEPVRQDYLESIAQSGNALLQLINDILDLSKMDSNQISVVNTPTDLNALCGDVIAMFKNRTQTGKLFLSVSGSVPPALEIDQIRLRQILFNLIGNAVKFTSVGGITLRIAFHPQGQDTGTLTVTVADTGCGISKQNQADVFDPFIQVNILRDPTTASNGSGLGLSVAQRLILHMGGSLRLRSAIGKGSVFMMYLPNVKFHNSMPVAEAVLDSPRTHFAGRRILLVDDIALNLKVLSATLHRLGAETVEMLSGESALGTLDLQRFDAVFTDLWMPEMKGDELAQKIHMQLGCENIPIIVISADTDGAKKLDKNVFQGYLSKPVMVEQLLKLQLWVDNLK